MAFLQWLDGLEPGRKLELDRESAVMGRSSECDLPLVNAAAVSRRHAEFLLEGDRHYIRDLGSRNGTLVNDRLIEEKTQLASGDKITICDQSFRYIDPTAAELGGRHPGQDSTLAALMETGTDVTGSTEIADDEPLTEEPVASVMATLDVSGGSTSWRMSAKPEVKLAALVEITQSLSRSIDQTHILPRVLDSLFKVFVPG